MTTYIKANKFYYPYETKLGGYLELVDDSFGKWLSTVPEGAQVLDYSGYEIAPGFVDTHIHGFAGADVMDNKEESLATMSRELLSAGVTSFLPTGLTASFETLNKVCQTTAKFAGKETGARIQGLFFEGPYFTEKYKGAQNPSYMRNPSTSELDQWLASSKGLLKKIALAPEREGTAEFISYACKRGVVVALGHSDATYQEAVEAVEAGASVWVHAYNGMRGLNHREPGMVGAVYNIPNTYAELICDGYHVHICVCDILLHQKRPDHVVLITDCMSAGGQPDGDYMLGEYPVTVENGTARLKSNGALAGSILQLKDGVKNIVDWGLVSKADAIMMASLIPAISVGIDDVCGQIKEGHLADFIVLDKEMNLRATYLAGKKVYECQ
ncbi:N-acetylglucosamine-6-phosphate deacetylase [Streptococcus mutans]|uniref:N-acetylglucosamine-6-phosphate deacetylase n=1 Tax=Streptococcus mutans SM6 TaxID=857119 RepID=A0A829BX49_STRMG|nr:N-acetylglucosamine-6-phosphate deacetylase [Streptococcus mutans]EMB54498.1 putative N-acetylglucosamine-6-phosphate deacetylase [Streptococcus mutans 11A1]EMB57124.1 putative N-acetylglucosamine-6-phosphate deacetylase [Streptococcus mutans NLML8]EMB60456.1 putative N-acetylglucosamine-6-phosphate deacetylase [Streptococcus mutans 15JP3]EMC02156.1 putative N-acetylglucosamine-6-phosphate deacetylase [Streptococcus mutans T4]EMC07855.1 putative N-acetylglucosamine-6-phosphate deacetylase [